MRLFAGLGDDVRCTLRTFKRAPMFSALLCSTLALGVGLISAILAFADGYLFRPLPFPGAERTYYVRDPDAQVASALKASETLELRRSAVAELGFVQWSDGNDVELQLDGRNVPIFTYSVSRGFRRTLPIPLVLGTDFSDEDHRPDAPMTGWLSHRLWRREFGSDWTIVGRIIPVATFQGPRQLRIAGVLGPEVTTFDLNNRLPDLVVPEPANDAVPPNQISFPLVLLPEGVGVDQARDRIASTLQGVAPAQAGKTRRVRLTRLEDSQLAGGKPTAKVVFAGAVLVLLLAALNLMHLLLGKGAARTDEVLTRVALGASRWRVVRFFIVEALIIGVIGTAAGILAGKWLSTIIANGVPELPTAGRNLAMVPMLFDLRIILISSLLGIVVATAGGLWPAWRAWRGSLQANSRTPKQMPRRLARVLLVSELAVVTTVGVGVVFIGLGISRYLNQPLGFDYADRYRIALGYADRRVTPAESVAALHAIRQVPGVSAAGFETSGVPRTTIEIPDRVLDTSRMGVTSISAGLFEAWGLRLVRGRWFVNGEFGGEDVVVVDARFARAAWPDADPVGRTVRLNQKPRQVVGVIEPLRFMLDRDPVPAVYVPVPETSGRPAIVVWAPRQLLEQTRERWTAAVTAAIPGATVTINDQTFNRLFARGTGEATFQTPILTSFGILAALLAAIGVFGIVSFLVHERTREFGIRLALGAQRRDITRTVLRESVQPAIAGLVIGAFSAWALQSVVQSTIFGWRSSGTLAIAIVGMSLLAVAVIAALVPAARACRVDPATALRAE